MDSEGGTEEVEDEDDDGDNEVGCVEEEQWRGAFLLSKNTMRGKP